MRFQKITQPYRVRCTLVERISVARVQPRTSKGITDLLLPLTSVCLTHKVHLRSLANIRRYAKLFSMRRSRSLPQSSNDKSLHQLRTAMHHHP